MKFMASRSFWRWRIGLFWILFVTVAGLVYDAWATLSFVEFTSIGFEALQGRKDRIGGPEFVDALVAVITGVAAGLLTAYFVIYVLLLTTIVKKATDRVLKTRDGRSFVRDYESIRQGLEKHPVLGHAWRKFDETLIRPEGKGEPLRNSVPPHVFFNIAAAREKLHGLKIMPGIPGFFVGLGLLLTFVGIVLALQQAGASAAGGDADGMRVGMTHLLEVASFKFKTSIAGLGASLVLSFFFRLYTIWIESAFNGFCEAVERRLLYRTPQSLAEEMNRALARQRDQLKEISSADFVARLREQIDRFAGSMQRAEKAFSDQVLALETTRAESRAAADVFGQTARDLRLATVVQAESSGKIADASQSMGKTMAEVAAELGKSQAGAQMLAEALAGHVDQLKSIWAANQNRFEKADEDLGKAFFRLGAEVRHQMESVHEYVREIDDGCRRAIDALAGRIDSLSQAAGELADAADRLEEVMKNAVQNSKNGQNNANIVVL